MAVATQGVGRGNETMDHLENVDWVTARAGCSAMHVFRKMKEEVRRDVEIRNRLRGDAPTFVFKFSDAGQSFTVALEGATTPASVTFGAQGDRIVATDQAGAPIAEATPVMSAEATCTLAMPGHDQPCEDWQFRAKALEHLFFVAPAA
jgi:hypothetical protein